MFRRFLFATSCMVLLLQAASAHTYHFYTEMDGASENPPNPSLGTGTSHVFIDSDLLTMRVIAEFSGLSGNVTQAHIHCCVAPPGNVGVASITPSFTSFPIGGTSGSYDFTYDMTLASSYNPAFITANGGSVSDAFQALFDAMAGTAPNNLGAYFNIHTTFRTGGEIRGFFTLIPEPTSAVLAMFGLGMPLLLRRSR
jgi:hypothetical protein